MTVVGFDEVEGGLVELPYLPDSPKDDPGELGTLCQPQARVEEVHDMDVLHLDNNPMFGEPCVLGSAMGGFA